jgi:hypothetical protein
MANDVFSISCSARHTCPAECNGPRLQHSETPGLWRSVDESKHLQTVRHIAGARLKNILLIVDDQGTCGVYSIRPHVYEHEQLPGHLSVFGHTLREWKV